MRFDLLGSQMDHCDDEEWLMESDEEIEYESERATNEENYHVGYVIGHWPTKSPLLNEYE